MKTTIYDSKISPLPTGEADIVRSCVLQKGHKVLQTSKRRGEGANRNAFTLAGGRSPLLNGDEGAQGSPKFAKVAFTLAEVLITLGVIGVVAAMTLPTLINEHRISQWETALKRDYTVLTQGFRKIMADYGCDTLECTGIFTTTTDEEGNEVGDYDRLDAAVRSAFHVVKSYKRGEGEERNIKYLKGKNEEGNSEILFGVDDYHFILNDSAIVYVSSSGCVNWGTSKQCGFLAIDVNGLLPPNTLGKDVFAYGHLMNDGSLLPDVSRKWSEYAYGHQNYTWRSWDDQCGKPNTKLKNDPTTFINGQNCLARIMENNWKMDYLH